MFENTRDLFVWVLGLGAALGLLYYLVRTVSNTAKKKDRMFTGEEMGLLLKATENLLALAKLPQTGARHNYLESAAKVWLSILPLENTTIMESFRGQYHIVSGDSGLIHSAAAISDTVANNPFVWLEDGNHKGIAVKLTDGDRTWFMVGEVGGEVSTWSAEKRETLLGMYRQMEAISLTYREDVRKERELSLTTVVLQEQNDAYKKAISGMHHDLAALGSTINGLMDDVKNGTPKEKEEATTNILQMMVVLSDMIRGMKTVIYQLAVKDFAGDRESLMLKRLFDRYFATWLDMQQSYIPNISVKVNIPDSLAIMANPTGTFQVIYNVLRNAYRYTKNGEIVVEGYQGVDGRVYLQVSDTGCGIAKTDLEQIGEFGKRGERTQDIPGNGIGMWITSVTLEKMGGTLVIESEENKGTTVTVGFEAAGSADKE